ncbi:DUF7544 domain-containing protein [Natronomonas sp. EA1]|uniref:DUF7544 domain-containing protein n=1 Tax=Natronomonas sp. EA1 TaxID=3421655 RepID=UPI003EBFBCAA
MSLHATENLETAFEATRDLLVPLNARRWVRLAAMVFFLGGVSMPGPGLSMTTESPHFGTEFGHLPFMFGRTGLLLVALVAVGLLVALAFAVVGSIMAFVLVEALVSGETRIREPFGEHVGDGLRLLGFRVLIGLFALLPLALLGAAAFALRGPGGLSIAPLLVAIPVFLVVVPVAAVVNGFTTAFVVPIMLREACGPVAGWKRLWPVVRGNLEEYGVYLLLSIVLSVVGGAAVSTVVGLLAAVLFIPAGLVGLFGAGLGLLTGTNALLFVLLAPFILAGGFALLAVTAAVRVPVVAYLRYYALLELGDTSEYDLLERDEGDDGDESGSEDGAPPAGTAGTA